MVAMVAKTMASYRLCLRRSSPSPPLHIRCFEVARVMNRLIALYKFLSDDEFDLLLCETLKSRGVSYLSSSNESFLLRLVCKEKLQELEAIVASVADFGQRCSHSILRNFKDTYSKLKSGAVYTEIPDYNSKYSRKAIKRMEKYVFTTKLLFDALQELEIMEASAERKSKLRALNDIRFLPKQETASLEEKLLSNKRDEVKQFKKVSLWGKSFNRSTGFMGQIIAIVYVRICDLFGPFFSNLPDLPKPNIEHTKSCDDEIYPELDYCLISDKNEYLKFRPLKSDPVQKFAEKPDIARFRNRMRPVNKGGAILSELRKPQDSAHTVGDAGLALRYANIITFVETCMTLPINMNDETCDYLYGLLTRSLSRKLKNKLCLSQWKKEKMEDGEAIAEGWREALEEMLGWLAPMAHDTVQWHTGMNLEKRMFEAAPSVLLMQTLHYADLEKTEDVMVDVLCGLNWVYKYTKRAFCYT